MIFMILKVLFKKFLRPHDAGATSLCICIAQFRTCPCAYGSTTDSSKPEHAILTNLGQSNSPVSPFFWCHGEVCTCQCIGLTPQESPVMTYNTPESAQDLCQPKWGTGLQTEFGKLTLIFVFSLSPHHHTLLLRTCSTSSPQPSTLLVWGKPKRPRLAKGQGPTLCAIRQLVSGTLALREPTRPSLQTELV